MKSPPSSSGLLRRSTPPGQLPPAEGMTLADLQEIGREVGIPAELVARAARSMDRGGPVASRSILGLPIGVGRTIDLERRLSDEEWDRLVVDLRETFDARGTLRSEGAFRQWTNGNLQALLEPTARGHRIRLRTVKGNARGLMAMGLGLLGVSVVFLVASAVTRPISEAVPVAVFLSAIGASMLGLGAVQLPSWARLRRSQMEGIAARLEQVAKSPVTNDQPPDHRGEAVITPE